jgi:Skp family chaperone for outer membrane proteins
LSPSVPPDGPDEPTELLFHTEDDLPQMPDRQYRPFPNRWLAATTLTMTLLAAPLATAQTPAAAPVLSGPAVPGVCLLGQEVVLATSKAGQAATARLRVLAQSAQAPLQTEGQAIQADARALEADKAKLTAAQVSARQQALSQRAQAYQARAQDLSRRIEATRVKAVQRISEAVQPVIAQVYQARGCGLLFSRAAVLGGNMSGDLTAAVIQGLDARMTTITFELEPSSPPTPAR